jgi:predicted RNA binding protein YcfA (HicA-like mRNA interferase family)
MTYQQLSRKLRSLGCELQRQSKGSHEIWFNPEKKVSAVVPRHSGDLPKGTPNAILKQLDITHQELDAA